MDKFFGVVVKVFMGVVVIVGFFGVVGVAGFGTGVFLVVVIMFTGSSGIVV